MLENALGTYPSAGLGILAPIRLWRVLYALQPCFQLFELQGVSFSLQSRLWLSELQKDLPVWSFPCCGQELPYPGWKSGAPRRNFTQFSSPVWLLPSSLGEGLGPNGGGKCNSLCSWSRGDPNQLSQPTYGHWKLAKDLASSPCPHLWRTPPPPSTPAEVKPVQVSTIPGRTFWISVFRFLCAQIGFKTMIL